jgi:hypothetical protein
MSQEPLPFAAFIGIDWADRKHDVCLRCWLDRKPYDEARYLMALQKRHAPLLAFAAKAST